MKKIILICSLILSLVLSGCQDVATNNDNKNTTSSVLTESADEIKNTTTQTPKEENTTTLSADANGAENMVTIPIAQIDDSYIADFFNALVNDDRTALAPYFACQPDALKFLDGINFEDAGLVDSKEITAEGFYNIALNVTESNSDMFPVGTYAYYFQFDLGTGCINYIGLSKNGLPEDNDTALSPAESFCVSASSNLNLFTTEKSVSDYINSIPADDKLIYNLSVSAMSIPDINMSLKAKTVADKCAKLFGDINVDFTKYSNYNKDTDELNLAVRGNMFYFAKLNKASETKDGIMTVTVDYYADSAKITTAKTMQYTLEYTDDDNFKLLSTELLADNNYPPAKAGL